MSRASGLIFKIAAMLSPLLTVASIAAACWTVQSQFPFENWVAFGNKELIGFHQGADFRIAFMRPSPIFVMRTYVPSAEELAREDQFWGRPNHWLKIPEFDFSLWWPFALSLVMPAIWFFRKRPKANRGFPVEPIFRNASRVTATEERKD